MDEIKHEGVGIPSNIDHVEGQSNQYKPLENQHEYITNISEIKSNKRKDKSPFTKRIIRGAGVILLTGIIGLIITINVSGGRSVNTSDDAVSAAESHMSTTLRVGTKILVEDDNYIGGDMTITHSSKEEETTIYVWDYAAQDGDYVQVYVDGVAISDPFMIKNKPVSFKIPSVCEVKVVGTRDGGGGITYAVYYDCTQTTYFNGMDQGGDNTYTLIRE